MSVDNIINGKSLAVLIILFSLLSCENVKEKSDIWYEDNLDKYNNVILHKYEDSVLKEEVRKLTHKSISGLPSIIISKSFFFYNEKGELKLKVSHSYKQKTNDILDSTQTIFSYNKYGNPVKHIQIDRNFDTVYVEKYRYDSISDNGNLSIITYSQRLEYKDSIESFRTEINNYNNNQQKVYGYVLNSQSDTTSVEKFLYQNDNKIIKSFIVNSNKDTTYVSNYHYEENGNYLKEGYYRGILDFYSIFYDSKGNVIKNISKYHLNDESDTTYYLYF